jgi:hypothetical protein
MIGSLRGQSPTGSKTEGAVVTDDLVRRAQLPAFTRERSFQLLAFALAAAGFAACSVSTRIPPVAHSLKSHPEYMNWTAVLAAVLGYGLAVGPFGWRFLGQLTRLSASTGRRQRLMWVAMSLVSTDCRSRQ